MAVQEPLIPYGDTEAIDIFIISNLKLLGQFYKTQQGDPKQIQTQAQWSRTKDPTYPLVTVMTTIDEYAPSSVEDLVASENGRLFAAEFNNISINIELQAYGLRELARLRSYLYLNLKYGSNPFSGEQWAQIFHNEAGIELLKWDAGLPQQVNLNVQGNLGITPMTHTNLERTDVEILWQQDLEVVASAQLGVLFDPDVAGIITGVTLNLTPDETGE